MKALDRAIAKAGGPGKLATMVGVAASAPLMWRQRESVPAEHCPLIELHTGVRCEALRPTVAWHVLRKPATTRRAA